MWRMESVVFEWYIRQGEDGTLFVQVRVWGVCVHLSGGRKGFEGVVCMWVNAREREGGESGREKGGERERGRGG